MKKIFIFIVIVINFLFNISCITQNQTTTIKKIDYYAIAENNKYKYILKDDYIYKGYKMLDDISNYYIDYYKTDQTTNIRIYRKIDLDDLFQYHILYIDNNNKIVLIEFISEFDSYFQAKEFFIKLDERMAIKYIYLREIGDGHFFSRKLEATPNESYWTRQYVEHLIEKYNNYYSGTFLLVIDPILYQIDYCILEQENKSCVILRYTSNAYYRYIREHNIDIFDELKDY